MPDNTDESELDKLYQSYLHETAKSLPAKDPAKKILEDIEHFTTEDELKLLARLEYKTLDEIKEEMYRDEKRVMIRITKLRRRMKIVDEMERIKFIPKVKLSRVMKQVLVRDLNRIIDAEVPIGNIGLKDTERMIRNADFCENCNHTRLVHNFGPCLNCGRCSHFREKGEK